MSGLVSILLKVLYFVIVFGIIVLLAYYTTRVLGKRVAVNAGRYMRVIDSLHIGGDKSLIIIKVEDAYLLLSCSNNNIELIKELDGFKEDLGTEDTLKDYLRDYGVHKSKGSGLFGLFRRPRHGGDGTDD